MDPSAPVSARVPATFAERGTYLPGTTPGLAGARVRRGADGLEFVLPNPANGRGVYVLRWDAVRNTLQPTLHDILLHNALQAAAAITPATVRAAARQVALDGAAGREARAAALHQAGAEMQAREAVSRHVLASCGASRVPLSEALVDILAAIGCGPGADGARLPRLLGRLQAMGNSARAAAGGDPALATLASAAATAAEGAAALLGAAQAQARNVGALLDAWAAAPGSMDLPVTRPGWFLDGWEVPCLMWEQAGRDAAAEVCFLLPVLPVEAHWAGPPAPGWAGARRAAGTDWRGGLAALGKQALNERLRALAA